MVSKGQLLERPVVIPAGEHCLDGIYLRGEGPGLLVASPLPGRGGSMASPVANEVAYAAAHAGRASLRLDYRGVGASEGEPSPAVADAVADLREGVAFLLESAGGEGVAVAGYGSGCWAALRLAREDPRVRRLLLVCCPRSEGAPEGTPSYAELERPVVVAVGRDDPGADLAIEKELSREADDVRLELLPGGSQALREGLADLARLVAPFLGAPPRA